MPFTQLFRTIFRTDATTNSSKFSVSHTNRKGKYSLEIISLTPLDGLLQLLIGKSLRRSNAFRAHVELFPLYNNCDSFKIKLVENYWRASNKASATKKKLFNQSLHYL